MEKGKIFEQHAENKEFMEKLNFYKDEIRILENRLAEIASKNSHEECLKDLEHFQNQLIVQANNIDEIKHLVVVDEDRLLCEIKKNEVASDHRSVPAHTDEKEAMLNFERIFTGLKKEMNLFFVKWM